MLFLGGGNPAHLPEVTKAFRDAAERLVKDKQRWQQVAGVYDSPQGAAPFLEVFAEYLNRHYSLGLSPRNIALTNGSQNSFFLLFNLFAFLQTLVQFLAANGQTGKP